MKEFSAEYLDYIESDEWREKAELRKKIDGYRCVMCGAREGLQVHHRNYKKLGCEDVMRDLVTLCPDCHTMVHDNKDEIILGICAAALILKLEVKNGGVKEFLVKRWITNFSIQESYERHLSDGFKRICIPVKEGGALVIPYFADPCEKDMRLVAEYLDEDFGEILNSSRKLYYLALEDGGTIEKIDV